MKLKYDTIDGTEPKSMEHILNSCTIILCETSTICTVLVDKTINN